MNPEAVLPRQTLLDIANQLASEGHHEQAAQAYERFLQYYPQYEHAEQVMLMAGILYARYLDHPDRAIRLLRQAAPRLTDPSQLRMCRDQLARLEDEDWDTEALKNRSTDDRGRSRLVTAKSKTERKRFK